MDINTIKDSSKRLIASVDTRFVRYLYDKINWDVELNMILGCRGVGKTTMMLQHIVKSGEEKSSLYVNADSTFFGNNTLYDTAHEFYKQGGRHIYIDEIHKYPGWSREIKMIYDLLQGLQITVSGSSMIDLIHGLEVDLSRRAIPYRLEGMSFREYLNFAHKGHLEPYPLDEILNDNVVFPRELGRPLPLFDDYIRRGYYPFFTKKEYLMLLDTVVSMTLEVDIPRMTNMSLSSSLKLKKLLSVLAQSTPFKPNFSNTGRVLEVNRGTAAVMIAFIERAGILRMLREDDDIMDQFAKVEKIYLANTNLCHALCDKAPDKGTLRETFFFSQMAVNHKVTASPVSDFIVDGHTFEVGGKSKKRKQIADVDDAYVVKDDIEYVYENIIPLWMFGLNY